MKKILTTISYILFIGIIAVSAQCCNNINGSKKSDTRRECDTQQEVKEVKVYYFHATRRCATCQAVENVTRESIREYYGDKVTFESINREENKSNPLVTKYKISGQMLLIVRGEETVNLTNPAFLNARTNPEKLKNKLKTTIDSLL